MLLHHIFTMRMMYGSTLYMRRAMGTPDQSKHALMTASVKPMYRPTAWKMVQIAAVILSICTWYRMLMHCTLETGVLPVFTWCWSYTTLKCISYPVNPWRWPVLPCTMDSSLTPFFYIFKSRLIKSIRVRMMFWAVVEFYRCFPMNKWTSLIRNRWCSVTPPPPRQYSPGISRNKKATQVVSLMVCFQGAMHWKLVWMM